MGELSSTLGGCQRLGGHRGVKDAQRSAHPLQSDSRRVRESEIP